MSGYERSSASVDDIIGRLGDDVTIHNLASGGRVANMSVATDESYIDRNGSGERIDRTEWHRNTGNKINLLISRH